MDIESLRGSKPIPTEDEFEGKWVKSEHRAKVLENEIERLNSVIEDLRRKPVSKEGDFSVKFAQYEIQITNLRIEIERLGGFEQKWVQSEHRAKILENEIERLNSVIERLRSDPAPSSGQLEIKLEQYDIQITNLRIEIERLGSFEQKWVQSEHRAKVLENEIERLNEMIQ